MTDRKNESLPDRGDTPGSTPPEKVEDRPSVGEVRPSDYPDPAGGTDVDLAGQGKGPGESGNNYEPDQSG
jgi:hypothetical protein